MAMQRPYWDLWVDDDGSGETGTIWNKGELKKLIDSVDGTINGAVLYAPTPTAIAGGAYVICPLGGVELDGGGYVTAAGTFTIPPGKGGLYLFTALVVWDVATAGATRAIQMHRDGTPFLTAYLGAMAGVSPTLPVTTLTNAVAGNVFRLMAYQDVATNIVANSRFGLVRV